MDNPSEPVMVAKISGLFVVLFAAMLVYMRGMYDCDAAMIDLATRTASARVLARERELAHRIRNLEGRIHEGKKAMLRAVKISRHRSVEGTLRAIEAVALAADVEIDNLRVQSLSVESVGDEIAVVRIPIELYLSGTYPKLRSFVVTIERRRLVELSGGYLSCSRLARWASTPRHWSHARRKRALRRRSRTLSLHFRGEIVLGAFGPSRTRIGSRGKDSRKILPLGPTS